MREFIPSDYVDKEGNVYETVGENIREGKNSVIDIGFPTPEEIGKGGLVGSDGEKYIAVLKNIGLINFLNEYLAPSISKEGIFVWDTVKKAINSATKESFAPIATRGVVEYVNSKLPYLKNAKTGIVEITINEDRSATVTKNDYNLNIRVGKTTSDNYLYIYSGLNSKNIISVELLACTTSSSSNFTLGLTTGFTYGYNSLYKRIDATNIKTITLFLAVEV